MFAQARALITGAIILVLLILAATIYWRGSSNQKQAQALDTARTTITVQRETAKIERKTDIIVNHETQQTATQAQEADNEIQAIRNTRPASTAHAQVSALEAGHRARAYVGAAGHQAAPGSHPPGVDDPCDAGCARILQLAAEARAAARASSDSLQPAGAGAR